MNLTFCEQSAGIILNELNLFCWMTISATCYALFFFFSVLLLAYREIIVEGSNRIDERAHCWWDSKMWDATPKRHGCKDEHLEYLESKVRVARVTWTNEPTNDGRVLIRCGFMSQREVSSGWRRENARWCKYRGCGAMRSVIALSLDLTARPRMIVCARTRPHRQLTVPMPRQSHANLLWDARLDSARRLAPRPFVLLKSLGPLHPAVDIKSLSPMRKRGMRFSTIY